jgi:hypothetical protein
MPRKADPALLKAVARARHWFEEIDSDRVRSAEVARREGLQKGYVGRLRGWRLFHRQSRGLIEGRTRSNLTCRG